MSIMKLFRGTGFQSLFKLLVVSMMCSCFFIQVSKGTYSVPSPCFPPPQPRDIIHKRIPCLECELSGAAALLTPRTSILATGFGTGRCSISIYLASKESCNFFVPLFPQI